MVSVIPVKILYMTLEVIEAELIDVNEDGFAGVVSSLIDSFAEWVLASGQGAENGIYMDSFSSFVSKASTRMMGS